MAAKEAAFQRTKKEEEFQRQLDIQAANREIALVFKKNQEKELQVKLEIEAAEKARFKRIAKEMKEKIEEDNRRQLEAERLAAQNLKEMKAAQVQKRARGPPLLFAAFPPMLSV